MYDYDINYSKRKSLSVSISALNKITVHCPLTVSGDKVEKFLKEKSRWIEKILRKNDEKISRNQNVLSYKSIYIGGETVPLIINAYKNVIAEDGVFVRNVRNICSLYLKTFSETFRKHVEDISYSINLIPAKIDFKDYKSRWGCCDGQNRIVFNYKVFMLPQSLQDYVIIHELCHINFHNHSTDFWNLVEKYYPKFKACRKELKNYDFLTRLY